MRVISYRFRTVADAFMRIKPLDSPLIHLMRQSTIVTTEGFYIDHDLDSVAAERQRAVRKPRYAVQLWSFPDLGVCVWYGESRS